MFQIVGCAHSDFITPEQERDISRDLTFSMIKNEPAKFRGRLVVLGGYVVAEATVRDRTEFEVLQLPLAHSDRPVGDPSRSQGRFLAFAQQVMPGGKMPPGSSVSMLLEVLGQQQGWEKETRYMYTTFAMKSFKIWPKKDEGYPVRPFGFWDRWGYPFEDPWTHPYWGAY